MSTALPLSAFQQSLFCSKKQYQLPFEHQTVTARFVTVSSEAGQPEAMPRPRVQTHAISGSALTAPARRAVPAALRAAPGGAGRERRGGRELSRALFGARRVLHMPTGRERGGGEEYSAGEAPS